MIRTTAVLLAAAASITFAASPAMAAPAAGKDLCKSGGYASYVDPATGAPFNNQGQCVSFVSKGGTLVLVETPPAVQVVTANMIDTVKVPDRDVFEFRVEAAGMTPLKPAFVYAYLADGSVYWSGQGTSAADGSWMTSVIGLPCDQSGTLVVRDGETGAEAAPIAWPPAGVCA